MKRFFQFTAALLVIIVTSSVTFKASAQYRDDISYQTFYDELSPHGNWIEYPDYGYVWQPSLGADFRPYSSGGHWVWSDEYEWTWVSDYDWGWAPFHYGRWFSDPNYGWLWVPGYEWSSAWVAWRDGGDYYGWAPLRPGISISINFNIGSYSPPYDYWCFTPRRYITSRNLYNYCVDRRQNVTIINNTTIINNYNYGGGYGFRTGPRRMDAERYIGRINPVRLRDSYSPGRTQFRNNEVSIYRPAFRTDNRNQAPRQFQRYDRNNTVSNGNSSNRQEANRTFDRNSSRPQGNSEIRNRSEVPNSNGSTDRRLNRSAGRTQPSSGNTDVRAPRNIKRPAGSNDRPVNRNNGAVDRNNEVRNRQIERAPSSSDNNGNRRFERRTVENPNQGNQARQREMRQPAETRQPRQAQPQQNQQRQLERRDAGQGSGNPGQGNTNRGGRTRN